MPEEPAFEISAREMEYVAERTTMLRESDTPEWRDARRRLESEGVAINQAVLAFWHGGGARTSTAVVATPDGRVFVFDVTYGFDANGRPLEDGVGRVERWEESTDKARMVEEWNVPDTYLEAVIKARRLHDTESG